MKDSKTIEVNITGIVQGVGFRPFLYNLARSLNLKGYILNRGNAGVRLVLQGFSTNINDFIENIKLKKPQISFIENVSIKSLNSIKKFDILAIKESEQGRGTSLTLPTDIAICETCLKDMRNPQMKKYYQYPFIACALCGPRFTTVKELPYDRERSTMIEFPFCTHAEPVSCIKEYSDFNNRRFHAQTFSCSVCGPYYTLYDREGEVIQEKQIKDILVEITRRLNGGDVLAIKGIGGTHLVCLVNDKNILKLRKRKGERKYKPFAVMVPNLDIVRDSLKISLEEREILNSFRRPIVLLEKKNICDESKISNQIAPGLNNIGIMLPYSGIHHLLFDFIGEKPLIYTSGNKSSIPMAIENTKIIEQLKDLADIFLLHNRQIYQRVDDSVLRIHDNKVKLIRRSRGFVPEYLSLPFEVEISSAIATGPELMTTGAILRRNRIFQTQHIGHVTHLETLDFLKESLFHMKNLLQVKDTEIKFIACDLHPAFITTQLAQEFSSKFNVDLYQIQHHYAHILSLMAENDVKIDEKIVGICTDGIGYGTDGNIWGGEIILSDYNKFQRIGHLEYQPMIGGDRCTKYPARMAASIILYKFGVDEASKIFNRIEIINDLEYKEKELLALISQYKETNTQTPYNNIPLTSSTGRIFDTISYLLGASKFKSYRGEPAMKLEGLASRGNPDKVDLKINYSRKNGVVIINTSELIQNILSLLQDSNHKKADIAAKFHIEMGNVFGEVAVEIARKTNVKKIGLTGGVAYNYSFSKIIKTHIINSGFQFLEHDRVAPGDAGISIGQLISGLFQYNKNK